MTTYPLVLNVSFGGSVSAITIQSGSGTGTGTVTIDDVAVPGLIGFAVTTTQNTYYATSTSLFSTGQDIKLEFPSDFGLANVTPSLAIIRSTPSQCSTLVTTASGAVLDGSKEENIIFTLSQNITTYTIPFGTQKTDSSGNATTSFLVLIENPVENIVDDASLEILARIVGKTSTGLTVLLSANPDSNNYIFRANVKVI
jgi:hypothetical protein